MIDSNTRNTAQREQRNLLHGLFIGHEVFTREHIPINECLITIHAIKYHHGLALVKYRQITDQWWWELVQQASHGIVHEQGRLRDEPLPFTIWRDVLRFGHDSFPFTTWHHLWQFLVQEVRGLVFQGARRIHDVFQLFLVYAVVVVQSSLVTHVLESLHMHMQVEITSDRWHVLEYSKCFNR